MQDKINLEDWNVNSKEYSNLMNSNGLFSRFALEALDRTMGVKVDRPLNILDVACGAGSLTINAAKRIAPSGGKVIAVDLAPDMINSLHKEMSEEGVKNIETHCMNGEAMTLKSNQYDYVYSILGVMLFNNKKAGLQEMYRLLQPDGQAAIVTMGKEWLFFQMIEEIFTKKLGEKSGLSDDVIKKMTIPYDNDLMSMFEEVGFKSVEIHHIHKSKPVNLDAFLSFLKTNPLILTATNQLPESKRHLLFPEIIDYFTKQCSDDRILNFQGTCVLTIGTKPK